MKMKILFYLSLVVLLASCKVERSATSSRAYSGGQGLYTTNKSLDVLEDDKYQEKNKAEETTERKIIYNSSLTLEVDSSQNAKAKVLAMAKEYKGYMVSSNTNSITVRIPSSDLESALKRFKGVGKLISESQSSRDVTDEYFDIQLRLDNAEKARKRYTELLEQAETVEEILKIEKELERLNEKIERFKGKIKSFDKQVDYSIISVYFSPKTEKVKPGPIGYVFVGLYKSVKWLFVRG